MTNLEIWKEAVLASSKSQSGIWTGLRKTTLSTLPAGVQTRYSQNIRYIIYVCVFVCVCVRAYAYARVCMQYT